MHLAKAIIACWRLAGLSGEELPLPELVDEAPFLEERCATAGLDEPPPQPARASATLRRVAAVSTAGFLALGISRSPRGGGCVASELVVGRASR